MPKRSGNTDQFVRQFVLSTIADEHQKYWVEVQSKAQSFGLANLALPTFFPASQPCRILRLIHRLLYLALLTLPLIFAGCEKSPPPEFRLNSVELLKQERLALSGGEHFDESYKTEIGTILHAMFGTPDAPEFPMLLGEEDPALEIISLDNLKMAAGPVNSDKDGKPSGLYREHCAHCHGITGCGAGPTAAFLNPYPRDFRLGKFKFKSTPLSQPPTDHDLETILVNGIPGTAMPSFRTLPEEEIDALVDYVKYLTMRGQLERLLMSEISSLDGEPIVDLDLVRPNADGAEAADEDLEEFEEQAYTIFSEGMMDRIIYRWSNRERKVTKIPAAPANADPAHVDHVDLVNAGRELFFNKGNCMQCHGATGMGDGQTNSYDDWTSDWVNGIDLNDDAVLNQFIAAGALPPRNIRPRNLHIPVFRGGSHPNDVYLRLANGIEGTPMPSSAALTSDEIWAIVAYVKALPYETPAVPATQKKENTQSIAK